MEEELCIRIDMPPEFKEEFKLALAKTMKEFEDQFEFKMAEEIISKSKFSEQDADELSEKVKLSMHEQLKEDGLI